jgi:hypothetical protein
VADLGDDAVHMMDVMRGTHVGHLAPPGSIAGPRGVCASHDFAAVSAWPRCDHGWHVVYIFQADGDSWRQVRVVGGLPSAEDGFLKAPEGVCISADCSTVAVVDNGNHRVSLFGLGDGAFMGHVATTTSTDEALWCVQECAGGWLTSGSCHTIKCFQGGNLHAEFRGDGRMSFPAQFTFVPGLGLVVRNFASTVQVYCV